MKVLSAVLVLVLAASSFGAITLGDGSVGTAGGVVSLPVTVDAAGGFKAVTVYAGWDQAGAVGFTYAPTFLANVGPVGAGATPLSFDNGAAAGTFGVSFTHDVSFGGGKAAGVATDATPVLIGTVDLTVPALPLGTVLFAYIDGADSVIAGTPNGDLTPPDVKATITVTPEPVTLALLALGGLFVARRRHA